MYWFWGILGAICLAIAVIYLVDQVQLKRREEERNALAAKRREEENRKISQIKRFYLKLNKLPFQLDKKQIIYIENEYDEAANEFILRNYDKICKNFRYRGYEFCYLPKLVSKINTEILTYYAPGKETCEKLSVKSNYLLDFMAHPENRQNIKPALIFALKGIPLEEGEAMAVCGLKMGDISLFRDDLDDILKLIIAELEPVQESWSLNRDEFINNHKESNTIELVKSADELFDDESQHLLREIREKIEQLKVKGISKYLLEQIIFEKPKPSRLVITHDYRILLPDYDNLEIEMTPLVKSVYILFLSHEEGISFKCLADYRKELFGIYMTIKGGGEPTEEILKSISAITDPFNNSINEKCARIREAFISKFDERIAEQYIVRGKRGEPKRITIPREKVEWQ